MSGLSFLFSPIHVGHLKVKNRIVFPPTGTGFATVEGFVTRRLIDHYVERAMGGAGVVMIEGTAIDPLNRASICVPGAWDDRHILGLKTLAEAVKSYGAAAFIQLNHGGPKALFWSESEYYTPVSASEIPIGSKAHAPRRMRRVEIKDVVERFVDASERVVEAGFDGVELHCAHLYLLSSFLSPYLNSRRDRYGGSVVNRCRIIVEIIKGVKERLGRRVFISCRINGYEPIEGGLKINDAADNAEILEKAGVDLINVSSIAKASDERIGFHSVPSLDMEEGCFVKYAEHVKRRVKVPVIGVGKIKDPVFANRLIEDGRVDLTAMCRALIADPELPKKAFEGRFSSIVKCVECMMCIRELQAGRSISCPVNPRLARST